MSDVLSSDVLDDTVTEVEHAQREANMWRARHTVMQTSLRDAKNQYNELKTHIQDVLRDADLWDDFDTEKLAKHGIVKPPTTYSCEYEVKYTGSVTVTAETEEAARTKADEIVTNGVPCQLSEIEDGDITDQTHNDFDVEINDCEEQ